MHQWTKIKLSLVHCNLFFYAEYTYKYVSHVPLVCYLKEGLAPYKVIFLITFTKVKSFLYRSIVQIIKVLLLRHTLKKEKMFSSKWQHIVDMYTCMLEKLKPSAECTDHLFVCVCIRAREPAIFPRHQKPKSFLT